jgi:hypothetical protein
LSNAEIFCGVSKTCQSSPALSAILIRRHDPATLMRVRVLQVTELEQIKKALRHIIRSKLSFFSF